MSPVLHHRTSSMHKTIITIITTTTTTISTTRATIKPMKPRVNRPCISASSIRFRRLAPSSRSWKQSKVFSAYRPTRPGSPTPSFRPAICRISAPSSRSAACGITNRAWVVSSLLRYFYKHTIFPILRVIQKLKQTQSVVQSLNKQQSKSPLHNILLQYLTKGGIPWCCCLCQEILEIMRFKLEDCYNNARSRSVSANYLLRYASRRNV